MLILARKKGQSIVINDNIEVYIIDIHQDQVKIGINAPREVTVHRKEIYDTIKSEMKEAASSSIEELKKLKNIPKKRKEDDPKEDT